MRWNINTALKCPLIKEQAVGFGVPNIQNVLNLYPRTTPTLVLIFMEYTWHLIQSMLQ